MTAVAVLLPLIALVGISGYLLPLAASKRREPPRFPKWSPWLRATTGWICVCLGLSLGFIVARVTAPGGIAAACIFAALVGVMQALWARDAARHL